MRHGEFSRVFTMERLTFSEIAERKGLNNQPADDVIDNGIRLSFFLDLIQWYVDEKWPGKKINLSSAYRSDAVNKAVGGSATSDHKLFCAADIKVYGVTPYELACLIAEKVVGYKQIIHEFGQWVHVAIPLDGVEPQLKLTTAEWVTVNGKRKALYTNGLKPL